MVKVLKSIFRLPGRSASRRAMTLLVLGIAMAPLGVAAAPPTPRAAPDIIFFNGIVVTIESGQPLAQAIAIKHNTILAVGSDAEILALRRPRTKLVDLQGKTLLPGFIEGHTHVFRNRGLVGLSLDQVVSTLLSNGLTSVIERGATDALIKELQAAERKGRLRVRVSAFDKYNENHLDAQGQEIILRTWYPYHSPILNPNKMLRVPGVKVFVDGAFTPSRGCPALSAPYPVDFQATPDFQAICFHPDGDLYVTQGELNRVVADAQASGYRVAFHAMGDRAIDLSLNAIQSALAGQSDELYRHQILHNSLLRPDQLTRYADLQILGETGPGPTCDQDQYPLYYGPARYEWAANRAALPGLTHAFSGRDYGWQPYPPDPVKRPLDPIMTLYNLVTHKELRADGTICEPQEWIAQHTISIERALQLVTIEPAYAVSMENYVGTLKPGKFADLVILTDNPLTVPADSLKDLRVLMTMVGGRVEYCAAGHKEFCP